MTGELCIEFALQGEAPAAAWAAQDETGQRALSGGPRGSFIIPLDYDSYLLVGEQGMGRHQIRAAYWKRGGSGFHENLDDYVAITSMMA